MSANVCLCAQMTAVRGVMELYQVISIQRLQMYAFCPHIYINVIETQRHIRQFNVIQMTAVNTHYTLFPVVLMRKGENRQKRLKLKRIMMLVQNA